jgi:hypothetical protein
MGLDARVYCNCYEAGKLRTAPPKPELVYVEGCGALACRDEGDDEIYFEFERWRAQSCEHPGGVLVHHRIGNMALVGLLRQELKMYETVFPLILGKVLYSGTHGGDWIEVGTIARMRNEVAELSQVHCHNRDNELYLRDFERQMSELIECSSSANKPIAF